ncbi:MAG: DUF3795 domain-containing protein [Fibrobacteraceae bacterium]|nr:DUF3795 domain-containing protein [Fibrobacteraceae bacterium]
MSNEIMADKELIAFCGLYCGACHKFLAKSCPGCRKNNKATWCKIRVCNMEKNIHTCADCECDASKCVKCNNFISKIFALLFRSDRNACLCRIKAVGEDAYAKEMAEKRAMTIKKGKG